MAEGLFQDTIDTFPLNLPLKPFWPLFLFWSESLLCLAWIGMTITTEKNVLRFGLIGRNIGYSFSKDFFSEKFKKEGLPHTYENYDISSITAIQKIIFETKNLKGLNVTIPYKEKVIALLDEIDGDAANIGAVNTIKISDDKKLKGYNTDHWGFQKSLQPFLPLPHHTALILGTGGASKAVAFALKNLGFSVQQVSRNANPNTLQYEDLNREIIERHLLIVNCTPLGTYPNIHEYPQIPFEFLTGDHLLYDLIYNPSQSEFLKQGKIRGTQTVNGLRMLQWQAEKAWQIWMS